ncbi:unnamed protein product [Rhizopus stolonifer]
MFTRPLACRLTTLRTYATKKKITRENKDAIALTEAFRVLKALEVGHPEHQIEAHVQFVLPKSIKQEPTILVFATGKKAEEAKAAGARFVGGEELIEQVKADCKDLGPKGLMPTVKKGTVTEDVAHTVRMSKSLFDFRADKRGVLHTGIGKVSFQSNDLEANLKVILEELKTFGKTNNLKAIIQNVVVSSTRGPGIVVSGGSSL